MCQELLMRQVLLQQSNGSPITLIGGPVTTMPFGRWYHHRSRQLLVVRVASTDQQPTSKMHLLLRLFPPDVPLQTALALAAQLRGGRYCAFRCE